MTMIRPERQPWTQQRFVVVFTEVERTHWWDRFLAPGFRHCYVLVWDEVVWLYVDPAIGRTRVLILDQYEPRHPREWIHDPDATLIEARADLDDLRLRCPWIFGPITCVEGVKAVLGIRKFWLFTPLQLFRYLRRRHGQTQNAEKDSRGTGPDPAAGGRAVAHGR